MTVLTHKLKREVLRTLDLDRKSRGRTIILELEPPDLIHFHFKGMRTRHTASIARLMQWTIQEEVSQRLREKFIAGKAARKERRTRK